MIKDDAVGVLGEPDVKHIFLSEDFFGGTLVTHKSGLRCAVYFGRSCSVIVLYAPACTSIAMDTTETLSSVNYLHSMWIVLFFFRAEQRLGFVFHLGFYVCLGVCCLSCVRVVGTAALSRNVPPCHQLSPILHFKMKILVACHQFYTFKMKILVAAR